MARMHRAMGWVLCALLPMLGASCESHTSGSAALPSWITAYPGTSPQSAGSSKTANGAQHDFTFKSADNAEKVLNFYQRQFLQNGLHMEARAGGEYGGMLMAEDDSHKRSVTINIRTEKSTSEVTISVLEK